MAHTKVFSPSGWAFDVPIASILKVSSDGRLLTNDFRDFTKRAGATGASIFRDQLKHIKVSSDEELIHLIAMGASEAYGPNRNGDGFRESVLKAAHDTFVKHAKWFRNHKNKPHEGHPFYGTVKLSAYNPEMRRVELLVALAKTKQAADRIGGLVADQELEKLARGEDIPVSMACRVPYDVCFNADALVETFNGHKRICDIAVGEVVKTHIGEWKPVLETMQRAYCGTVVRLEVCGIPDTITCTAKHPFLFAARDKFAKCHGTARGRKRRHTVRNGNTCTTCSVEVDTSLVWTDAENMRVGDFVVYPINRPGTVSIPVAEAYLAGIYVGDGSLIRQRRGRKKNGAKRTVGFSVTLDKAHASVLHRVRACAEKLHGRKQPHYESGDGKNSWQVPIYSTEFGQWLETLFGSGAADKRVPPDVFTWDEDARLAFIAGLIDSDGSVDCGSRYGSGRFTSTNRYLAESVQKLFWGIRVPSGFHQQTMNSTYAGPVEAYVVSVPRSGIVKLRGVSAKCENITVSRREHSKAFFLGDYIYLPITRIVHEYDELDVYNLHVADDESYIVGVAVHNCSGCGNKARTRDEYCKAASCKYGGCADNLTKLVKVGNDTHILHVDNVSPSFFDISKVWRPADRIAHGAQADYIKVAADNDGFFEIGGAKTASDLGVTAPLSVIFDQDVLGNTTYSMQTQAQIKMAHGLAAIENRAYADKETRRAFDEKIQPAVDHVSLGLHDPEKRAAALTALADQKIVLPLREFVKMAGDPALTDMVAQCMKGVYSRMIQDDTLAPRIETNKYTMTEKLASAKQRETARILATKYSLDREHVKSRCQISSIRGLPIPSSKSTFWNEKKAHDSAAVEELARSYAVYTVAALTKIAAQDTDFVLTAHLAAVQNTCI